MMHEKNFKRYLVLNTNYQFGKFYLIIHNTKCILKIGY